MILNIAILTLVLGTTVLTVALWITHRDMEELRRDFRTLVNEIHADRVLMRQAIASMDNAVSACQLLAEAVVTLARKRPP
jgi:hypothetical protein